MIFTNSMSDFFHEKIPFEFLDRVIEVIQSDTSTYLPSADEAIVADDEVRRENWQFSR